MKTILEIITLSADYLQKKGIPNFRRQAEDLVADALDMKRLDLYLRFDQPLNDEEMDRCRQFLQRRTLREPQQYIKGSVDFFDCTINVNPHVLIPRQETEILVDTIAKSMKDNELEGKSLLDLCCGSGCIGISLKKRFPQLHVILSDLSADALAVAKENAKNNEVEIEFLQGDLLAPLANKKVDFIVCNPPYLTVKEFVESEPEVQLYEPRQALVGGESGLEFYERLAKELKNHLSVGAKVWLELGSTQGEAIKTIFESGNWKKSTVEKDWAGHDRFFFLEIE
jgi:release factor glutamine methyltransferase